MNFAFEILIAFIVVTVLIVIITFAKEKTVLPVPIDKDVRITVVLNVTGDAENLEQTVEGLVWMVESGTLKADIAIIDGGMTSNAKKMAEFLSKDSKTVFLCDAQDYWKCCGED